MLLLLQTNTKNQRGFTMIELMATVVIISVLVAIAVPIYRDISENIKKRADEASIRVLNGAAAAWALAQDPIQDLHQIDGDQGNKLTLEMLQGESGGAVFIDRDFPPNPQSQHYNNEGNTWDDYWENGAFRLDVD